MSHHRPQQEKLPWAEEVLVSKADLDERRARVTELEQQASRVHTWHHTVGWKPAGRYWPHMPGPEARAYDSMHFPLVSNPRWLS